MPATTVDETTSAPSILDSLTVNQLAELKRALGLQVEEEKEAGLPPDRPLAEPVRFWNARAPNESVMVPGRSKKLHFWAGTVLARTERELAAVLAMGTHVHRGDDLDEPLECPTCKQKAWNRAYYQEHVGMHAK